MKQALLLFLLSASLAAQSGPAKASAKQSIPLPTSKYIYEPVPGSPLRTNSLPTAIAMSPNGRYAAILNNGRGTVESGFQQSIAILDLETNRLSDFPDPRLKLNARQSYFLGLAFSGTGDEVFASVGSLTDPEGTTAGDTGNGIAVYSFREGQLQPARFLKIPLQPLAAGKHYPIQLKVPQGKAIPYPAGLAVIPAAQGQPERLLVANNLSDSALLLDASSGQVLRTFDLSDAKNPWVPATYPYSAMIAPGSSNPKRAWVSLWNTGEVAELNLETGAVRRIAVDTAPTGPSTASAHPTAMALDARGERLYVALANRDKVVAVDTKSGRLLRTLSTQLPNQLKPGTYPNALAFSKDGSQLYVAAATLDAVAVFNLKSKDTAPAGFIPTEWYPTALATHGNELLIATGKGEGTGPSKGTPYPGEVRKPFRYIGGLIHGSVARLDVAQLSRDLPEMTQETMRSNLMGGEPVKISFRNSAGVGGGAAHNTSRPWWPIKHVIYVIKENRTYDQLLGDLGVGDGDPSIAIYGKDITPNHHKLALQFGVLDNFYDSGEVSGDGHVWSTAAISSDYTERTWQIGYRGRERTYDYEGVVANEIPLKQGIPDVDEPGTGYLWANAARHGLTYRHYGEFVNTAWCFGEEWAGSPASTGQTQEACRERKFIAKGDPLPQMSGGGPSPYPWKIPVIAQNIPTKPELVGHFDPNAADFRIDYPDQFRADEFIREFNGFVQARKNGDRAHELPQLVVMRLPNDHTAGTTPGMPKPAASVADCDLALGRIVEAVSHSPYWDDTAILVLEDDAQDGPDHVDAHRSIGLVISKYSPRQSAPFVDHRFYTTVNMIRTLEDLLGLPPMNHNDAQAAPIAPLFSGHGDQPAYTADTSNRDNGLLYQVNPPKGPGAKESAAMDFSQADKVDSAKLNEILWHDRKGATPMPAPKHTVIPDRAGTARDNDDD